MSSLTTSSRAAVVQVSPDPEKLAFKVKVDGKQLGEGGLSAKRGAAYTAFGFKELVMVAEDWGDYVFDHAEDAELGYLWLHFVQGSTGVAQEGKVFEANAVMPPDKFVLGATFTTKEQTVPYGTSPASTSLVLSSEVAPMNGVHSKLNNKVLLSYDGTPLYSWVLDEDTGKGYQVKEELVVAGTVGSTEVAADGTFASVVPVNAKWSIKTTKKTTTLTNVPRTWSKTERSEVLWPTVLLSLEPLAILDAGSQYWHKRYTGMLMPSYTGDVIVEYAEWWQKSAPAPLTPTEMVPTKVSIKREWSEDVIIEPCLHSQIVVQEVVVVGRYPWTGYPDTGLRIVNYTVPATKVVTWPDTVVKLDVNPFQGGYRCLKRTIYKPTVPQEGITITITPFVPEHYVFTGYADP